MAAASVGSVEEDGKRRRFNGIGLYKAITLSVLTPVTAGVVAVGGVIPGHHLFQPLAAAGSPCRPRRAWSIATFSAWSQPVSCMTLPFPLERPQAVSGGCRQDAHLP